MNDNEKLREDSDAVWSLQEKLYTNSKQNRPWQKLRVTGSGCVKLGKHKCLQKASLPHWKGIAKSWCQCLNQVNCNWHKCTPWEANRWWIKRLGPCESQRYALSSGLLALVGEKLWCCWHFRSQAEDGRSLSAFLSLSFSDYK